MVLAVNFGTVTTFAAMSDEAESISVNKPVTDNLSSVNDVKYYEVELPAPGKVNLSFSGTNTTGKSMNAYLSEGTYYIRVTTDDYWHSEIRTGYRLTIIDL